MAVLSGMAMLLVVVAVLQYQWVKHLRAASELQIGSHLQSVMTSWHRDLYDELSAICIALQVGPDSGAHDGWDDYLQRYADWNRDGGNGQAAEAFYANPQLIRDIFIWQTSGHPSQLLRLSPDGKGVKPSSIAKQFEPLLGRLQVNSSDLHQAFQAWKYSDVSAHENGSPSHAGNASAGRSNALSGWQFDPRIPAIVHPLLHHVEPFDDGTPVKSKGVDWIVVVLDLDVLKNHVLPQLTTRHFGREEESEYDVALIVTSERPKTIYASDPAFNISAAGEFDAAMNVFGRPPTQRNGRISRSSGPFRANEWRNFAAPAWFPVIRYASDDESWLLILQPRTSPVEEIARSLWRRDLIIAGVVLLLMAANMTLIVLAENRAQHLAKVQMEFVASVSHELRTPLAAVSSAGQNIRDGFVPDKESLKFYGSLITGEARQLTDLVERILLFASVRQGNTQYIARPLTVSEILQSARKSTADLLERSGYRIEEYIEPGVPLVLGDMAGICACLQNFISNATKYGGIDHWIGINVSCHDTRRNGEEVRISVVDHGQGISASERKHIFEPFYRSPGAVRAQIHGTGLGLALSKQIAESLGGRISVESKIGEGSTFTLHLRAASEAEQERFLTASKTSIGN